MLWVPFALNTLVKAWEARTVKPWALPLVALLVLLSSLGGIFDFGHSKAYMRNAGEWLSTHTLENALIYSNDYQVMYYSQRFGNDIFQKIKEYSDESTVANGHWKDYDYLVIRLNKKDFAAANSWTRELSMAPLQVFTNDRGDQVRIYKIEE